MRRSLEAEPAGGSVRRRGTATTRDRGSVRRVILLAAACAGLVALTGASPGAGAVAPPAGPIIDLDFGNISGATVPDASGSGNDGTGRKGAAGAQTSWTPSTTTDSQGIPAVVFDGTQKQRIEIPNTAGSLDVDHFSILVRFTLHPAVDTDPAHQRYELMEKAGSFWFNVREDTTPGYPLRVGGFFNGNAADTFTGTQVVPGNTLTWAVATYDGAHLRTYVAAGDGTNLALDRSVAQTGTLNTGPTITGVDENLVVGAKHRKGHAPGGSGTNEDVEAFFNGTMSRFIVYPTALTQSQIASVISGAGTSAKPGPVRSLHPAIGHEHGPQRHRSVHDLVDDGDMSGRLDVHPHRHDRREPGCAPHRYGAQRDDPPPRWIEQHDRRRLRRPRLRLELHVDRVSGGRRRVHRDVAQREPRGGVGRHDPVDDRRLGVCHVPLLVVPGARLGDR